MGKPSPPEGLLVNEGDTSIAAGYAAVLANERGGVVPVTLFGARASLRGLLTLLPSLRRLTEAGTPVRILAGAYGEGVSVDAAFDPTRDPSSGQDLNGRPDRSIREEIDGLPLTRNAALVLLDLLSLLDSGRVQCRRDTRRAFGASGLLLPNQGSALIGSPELSPRALTARREMVGRIAAEHLTAAAAWIDRWWIEADPFPLANLIRVKLSPHQPQLVFLRLLQLAYGDEVNAPSWDYLHDEQCDGVAKILAIFRRGRGALLCDDVGIGKTDQALAVARHLSDDITAPVLIVCPASLQDMWRGRAAYWGIRGEVVSYHKLTIEADDDKAGEWVEYGLVIADEAHHLRNPARKRLSAVRRVLAAQPRAIPILLVTATPVNNSGLDLFELLSLADPRMEPNWSAVRATSHVRKQGRDGFGRALFEGCRTADTLAPESVTLRNFHDELDQRMVRRSRWLLQQEYPSTAKSFPTRMHHRVEYVLTPALRRLTGEVLDALDASRLLPATAEGKLRRFRGPRRAPALTLAAYQPQQYELGSEQHRSTSPMAALIKTMLLKRLESSPAAFASTAHRMAKRVAMALHDLEQGYVCLPDPDVSRRLLAAIRAGAALDEEPDTDRFDPTHNAAEKFLLGRPSPPTGRHVRPAVEFDVGALRAALTNDLTILRKVAAAADEARHDDAKFDAFVEQLARLATDRPGEKILVMSSSRVTTTDLHTRLTLLVDHDPRLHHLRGRIANAAPPEPLKPDDLLDLVAQFAPNSAARSATAIRRQSPANLYQLLIASDMLAEGHNLQDASIIVNYDLPWNPQGLEQRIGRVDRHGAVRPTVACLTLLPDAVLDVILGLMRTLHNKISIAEATVGVPSAVLPDIPAAPRDFATALDALDNGPRRVTVPEREHLRALLGNALRLPGTARALADLPTPAGAVHPLHHDQPGAVFCFRIDTHEPPETVFCYLPDLPGALADFDQSHCLRLAHVDLRGWTPPPQSRLALDTSADTSHFQSLLLRLLDRARHQTASRAGIPTTDADTHIHLIAWMAFLRRPKTPAADPDPTR
ncbi:SNF2-related protein [Plantactinospora solaniradicis]|uniref:SNF2-related protein n=1 Tax=Plantactinospora solaniradicis TaxID=1723736 RepID=A0ABW1KFF7_9ACTN